MGSIRSKILGALLPLSLVIGVTACATGTDEVASDGKVSDDEGTTSAREDAFAVALHGGGVLRGHEDLTRLAIDGANAIIGDDFYPTADPGDRRPQETNFVIQGNYETDVPSTRMRRFHPRVQDWHNDPAAQNIHALRNYPGGRVETAKSACLGARQMITNASKKALATYDPNDLELFFYYAGHATHTLQDSFSAAHVARSGAGRRKITDVCTYGNEFPGVCSHAALEPRDTVWRSGGGCLVNPWARDVDCLKPEAAEAVTATRDYLVVMEKVAKERRGTLESGLGVLYGKYLNCDAITR